MPIRHLTARCTAAAAGVAFASAFLAPTASGQTAAAPITSSLQIVVEKPAGTPVLQGDRWTVLAVTPQYVAGTTVRVSFTAGARRVTESVPLQVAGDSARGIARLPIPDRLRRAARVVVRAEIPDGQPVAATAAPTTIVSQVPTTLRPGARGLGTRVLQQMLTRNAYVVGREGVYDARTQRAVLALRKVSGLQASTAATPGVFRTLRAGKGRIAVKFPTHGRHIEVDVDRRVLIEVDGGKPLRIFHTSPGKPSTPTIRGSFRVYRKDPGTNALGMFKSSYFIRGYAVHGYPSVPAGYSASHGCLRVPMADAASIYAFMTLGMPVDTY
ncbi:L,D-transpeptidase [Patulibacter sp. NPDC049589]|uniref:L,D-transpeptidase family protein n=1 Tax=Patulibacter sp. NPDC049589 TaxID=3154731 RepID=UPI003420DF8B